MTRRWLLILCLVLVVAAVSAGGLFSAHQRRQAEASQLVRQSLAAERTVRAKGTLEARILAGGQWRESRAEQKRDGLRSVTSYADGPEGVRIVDTGKKVARVDDRNQRAVVVGPAKRHPGADVILRNYRPVLEGETSQAGREARLLALRSRHRRHLAKRVALDRRTTFPLRTQTYNADGKLVSESAYQSIQFDVEVDPKDFEVPQDYEIIDRRPQRQQVSPAPKIGEVEPALPTYVPQGYELEGYYAGTRHHVVRFLEIRYTDGLRDLSLYEHLRGTGRPKRPDDEHRPPPSAAPEREPGAGPGPGVGPRRGPGGGRAPAGARNGRRGFRGDQQRQRDGEAPTGPDRRPRPPTGAGRGGPELRGGRGRPPEGGPPPEPREGADRPPGPPAGPPRQRFGPPTKEPQLIERGRHKVVRMLRGQLVIMIVGDLTQEDMLKVAESIPEE